MYNFIIKTIEKTNLENELINVGYDKSYAFNAINKFQYVNFKIFNITPAQGNIIKQLALSVGADCATHHDVITGKIENSNCILGGNFSQIKIISKKLQLQPFGLKGLGLLLENKLPDANKKITKIMGILNVTQNSFSDGGEYYKFDDAIRHLNQLIEDGADIIDIGAESTKPYSEAVSADDQLEKILPILEYINKNNIKNPTSIDTRSAKVANECIKSGAEIINDVSGLDYDPEMIEVLAKNSNIKIIIQHSKGTPLSMQDNPSYANLMDEIYIDLKNKTDFALSNGIKTENIIVDPGIGFGKTREHNFEIIRRWKEFKTLGYPVILGISRKSLLNMSDCSNYEKDIYTLALNSILINDNIDYIRVHNVKMHKKLLEIQNL